MKKPLIILSLLFMLSLAFSSCKEKDDSMSVSTDRPNILLIIADDMGIEACPNYSLGATKPTMPHLQSFMNKGITFDNVWAYPVCSPTRSSILTGKYGFHTGVLNPTDKGTISPSETSLQQYISNNSATSYSNAIIGKWHLGNSFETPINMGINHYSGIFKGAIQDYYSWPFVSNGAQTTVNTYCTEKLTDEAINWIGNQDKNWFCWLAYTSPHTPIHNPPKGTHNQGDLSGTSGDIDANPLTYFMAMMENMDYEIGRLLDNIPEEELENTVILFIGDNGTTKKVLQNPYRPLQGKSTLYQGGIHVPMVVSGAGVNRVGVRENSMISSTDLFATIAEISGAKVSTYENSYSFYNLLSNSNSSGHLRQFNYSEMAPLGYTIRNAQYKLIAFDDGSEELYDLLNDPYERNNLLDGSLNLEQTTAKAELEAKAKSIRQ